MTGHDAPRPVRVVSSPALVEVAESVTGLVDAFASAGHRLYLVGGAVRDLLVAERHPSPGTTDEAAGDFADLDFTDLDFADPDFTDLDFTTDAVPAEIARLVKPFSSAVWTQGERFGTIGAKVGDRLVEITTHRAEAYDDASRKPVVTFGHSIEDDLARRDFTINAIAVLLPGRELVDPFDGQADLTAGLLRTPLAPEVSFSDDPLRMLRAARFLARFHLRPAAELVAAAEAGAARLAIVSAERVQAELEKQLAITEPGPGLDFLYGTGLLDHVVPELARDAGARAEAVALAGAAGSPLVRRAGLLVPIGVADAAAALRRLRYSRAATAETLRLVGTVPETLTAEVGDKTVRVTLDSIGFDHVDELIRLSDNVRRHRQLPGPNPFQLAMDRLAEREDLTDLDPPVSGGDLIAHLGMKPGPAVGDAVAFLKKRRLESGPMTESEALAWVEEWLADAPKPTVK
jgi:poly(A) polymerase